MRLPLFLAAALAVALADLRAANIADLDELDQPPRRIGYEPVALTDALRATATSDTVTMVATVGPGGRVEQVTDVKAATPAAAEAATAAVRKWVFTGATAKGAPVSFRIPVSVAIRPGQESDAAAGLDLTNLAAADEEVPATVAFETVPVYPSALKDKPVDGAAVVNVLIATDGRPSDPVVEFATRTEFALPAARAVLDWIFTPWHRGGQAHSGRTTVEVVFPAASAGWDAEERDFKARLRYLRSYDEAPRQDRTQPMVFPYEALIERQYGGVSITVIVDPNGRVARITPDTGANPDFVGAARASIAGWNFIPARKAGQPVFGMVAMILTFEPYRQEFQFDDATFTLIEGLRTGTATVFGVRQVDRLPAPISQVKPVIPLDHDSTVSGEALVEIFIDAAGRPQLPRVVRATTPDLGWAAATAVAQWRFEPAQKDGQPVTCRARVPIKFHPAPPAGGP